MFSFNNIFAFWFHHKYRYKVELYRFGSQLVPDSKMILEADHHVRFTPKTLGMDVTPGNGRFASLNLDMDITSGNGGFSSLAFNAFSQMQRAKPAGNSDLADAK